MVVRVKEVQATDLAKDVEPLARFGTQLDSMMANDLVAQLLAALRLKYGVSVDDATFAAVFPSQQQQQQQQ